MKKYTMVFLGMMSSLPLIGMDSQSSSTASSMNSNEEECILPEALDFSFLDQADDVQDMRNVKTSKVAESKETKTSAISQLFCTYERDQEQKRQELKAQAEAEAQRRAAELEEQQALDLQHEYQLFVQRQNEMRQAAAVVARARFGMLQNTHIARPQPVRAFIFVPVMPIMLQQPLFYTPQMRYRMISALGQKPQ